MSALIEDEGPEARIESQINATLGPDLLELANDPELTEIFIRPDKVFVERLGIGLQETRIRFGPKKIVAILRLAVKLTPGSLVTVDTPRVECDVPWLRARFAGLFDGDDSFITLRLHRVLKRTMEDYYDDGGISEEMLRALREVLRAGASVLVVGPTGSGKTTALRAIVDLTARLRSNAHFVTIEDSPELKYGLEIPFRTSIVTRRGFTLAEAVESVLRHKPTEIIVGEVRGKEAAEANNCALAGHPVKMSIHSHSASGGLRRYVSCVAQGVKNVDYGDIAEALDVVCSVGRQIINKRDVFTFREMIRVIEYGAGKFITENVLLGGGRS